MAPRLMLIADDLTGAVDTGVQFSRRGVSTLVATGEPRAAVEAAGQATVLAVDIESRHLLSGDAAARVERCVEAARESGIPLFYKKTDSTLRGNVGAELAALLRAAGGRTLFFAPALPSARRITRDGVQLVDGVPVHQSVYSGDVASPVVETSVRSLIRAQSDVEVICVPRGEIGDRKVVEAQDRTIVVFDAETDLDLQRIADRLAVLPHPLLLAGSAGFASVLPDALRLPRSAVTTASLRPPLLVVCGSRNEVSRSQIRQAEARGISSWQVGGGEEARGGDEVSAVAERLRSEGIAILKTPDADSAGSIAALARLAGAVWRQSAHGTIAAFGGNTAFAVLKELNVSRLVPLREICQGTVACRLAGTEEGGTALVTKAGGFGPNDVIQRIWESLAEER